MVSKCTKGVTFESGQTNWDTSKGNAGPGLFYPTSDSFDLIIDVDADYAGFLVDREITLEMAHLLGSTFIS